uniref:Uncharacterized protein n=1 Tax=Glypta fumiferanae TaxID=389681 RepID=A0A0F6T1F1_9HYME|nr:hypothetical protein [Glypta fumiferanae]
MNRGRRTLCPRDNARLRLSLALCPSPNAPLVMIFNGNIRAFIPQFHAFDYPHCVRVFGKQKKFANRLIDLESRSWNTAARVFDIRADKSRGGWGGEGILSTEV